MAPSQFEQVDLPHDIRQEDGFEFLALAAFFDQMADSVVLDAPKIQSTIWNRVIYFGSPGRISAAVAVDLD
jgi:hypothetical protein